MCAASAWDSDDLYFPDPFADLLGLDVNPLVVGGSFVIGDGHGGLAVTEDRSGSNLGESKLVKHVLDVDHILGTHVECFKLGMSQRAYHSG